MDSKSLWLGVAEVLVLLKEYSEKHKPPRPSATKLERLSGWAVFIGAVMYLSGEVLRQLGDHAVTALGHAYVVLSVLGLLAFLAAAVGILVDFFQTTRRPFVEHLDGIIGALDREYKLIAALLNFETVTLELASERLSLQSIKVAGRVGMIGGGDGLKTS